MTRKNIEYSNIYKQETVTHIWSSNNVTFASVFWTSHSCLSSPRKLFLILKGYSTFF